jgi:Cytochrome P460
MMTGMSKLAIVVLTTALAALGGRAISGPDRYTVRVPGGLAFSEFRGYENWPVIAISENGGVIAVIVGNPVIMHAFRAGVPGNGKPFPDGSRMAKIHWKPRKNAAAPGGPTVPGTLANVDFMVKDSKRFSDSGGWGWGAFEYDAATDTFRPGTTSDYPPQAHDAKCGFACHTAAKDRDYVFTEYGKR